MIGPFLPPRVPQSDALSSGRIPSLNARRLELIARVASQPKVLFNGLASFGFGNDVLDTQTITRNALGRQAITTTIASRLFDAIAQATRHVGFAGQC
jgi:hypothetical protein